MKEIPRLPQAPKLCGEAIEIITNLCFGNQSELDSTTKAALIFGTPRSSVHRSYTDHLADVVEITGLKKVYITGGRNNGMIESEEILNSIRKSNKLSTEIQCLTECVSKNTNENITAAIKLGLDRHQKIVFLTKWCHCGRCVLTIKKYLPQMEIQQRGCIMTMDGTPGIMEPDYWYYEENFISYVWGEFLRIWKYGSEGIIDYPDEVREKVERVINLTSSYNYNELHCNIS